MTENRIRVLIIDDSETFLAYIKEAFSDEFDLTIFQDGAEGAAWARDNLPDILLLDVNMPGLSGIEVVKKLQAAPETRRIPVIVVSATAYNRGTESLFRREKNVKGFLTKLSPMSVIKEAILNNAGGWKDDSNERQQD